MLRQLLLEGLILAGTGGLLGVLLAHGSLRMLAAWGSAYIPRLDGVEPRARIPWAPSSGG